MNNLSVTTVVQCESPQTLDASVLLDELSAMIALYGADGGQSRFRVDDVSTPRSLFAVARTPHGQPIGCGALRRFSFETAEFKRIYRRPEWPGAGAAILLFLETAAMSMGYRRVLLQTRKSNRRALAFYLRHAYMPTDPYGEYAAIDDALCLTKVLPFASEHHINREVSQR